MSLVVAYHVPHNEGVEAGVITGLDFDCDTSLVDLYEVDAQIKPFASQEDAEEWVESLLGEDNDAERTEVPGGILWREQF